MAECCDRCNKQSEFTVKKDQSDQWQHSSLDAKMIDYLSKTQYQQLCKACLQELNDKIRLAAESKLPKSGADFEEGLHYQVKDGLWIFTEFYHIQRGYCCKSGCVHCAYGFKK
jgi:hypothetical protein